MDVTGSVLAVRLQVEDRVADQLPRSVVGHVAVRAHPVVLEQTQPHQRSPSVVSLGEAMRLARQAVQPVAEHTVAAFDQDCIRVLQLRAEAVAHLDLHDVSLLASAPDAETLEQEVE